MSKIPLAYLLIQVSDEKYLPEVIDKIDDTELEKIKSRTIIVTKNLKKVAAKVRAQIRKTFP